MIHTIILSIPVELIVQSVLQYGVVCITWFWLPSSLLCRVWGLEDTQRFNICAKLQDKKAGLDYFECVTQPTAEATRRPFTSQCDTTELESRKSRKGEFAVCNSRCMLECVFGVVLPSCHHVSLELCQIP